MSLTIRVYSDFVCPFCYLAQKPLKDAVAGRNVKIEWMPFELRPHPSEPLELDPEYLDAAWNQGIRPMAKQFGVTINMPNINPHPRTDLAHQGFQFAKEQGLADEYHERVFDAYFQEGQDIGNVDVLVELAKQVGLDPNAFREALSSSRYNDAHRMALYHAYREAGVSAVPTFHIGNTVLRGVQPPERLAQVIDRELGA